LECAAIEFAFNRVAGSPIGTESEQEEDVGAEVLKQSEIGTRQFSKHSSLLASMVKRRGAHAGQCDEAAAPVTTACKART
jgi:hypothetical protein